MAANKTIPRRYIDNYSDVLDALSAKAQKEAANAISKVPLEDLNAARQALLDMMQTMCAAYANSAASVSARFYEVCRNLALGGEYEALTEANRDPDGTRIAVLGIVDRFAENGNAESLITQLLARIDYEIKRAAGECTFANMDADPFRG